MRSAVHARIAIFLSILALHSSASAAWRQQAGKGIIIQSVMEQDATSGFDADGQQYPLAKYTARRLQTYAAYGLPQWPVTVGANIKLVAADQYNYATAEQDHTMAIEDPEIFARTVLWDDITRSFAIEPFVKLPSQTADDEQRLAGNVHYDYGLRFYYGEKFEFFGLEHYSQSMVGFRRRDRDLGNQWEYEQTLSINLSHDYHLLLQGFGTESNTTLQTGKLAYTSAGDYNVIKSQISLLVPLEEAVHLQLGYLWDIEGNNTIKSRVWSVGIWQRF